jgi:DNA-binding FrmR family transcriptional regulator
MAKTNLQHKHCYPDHSDELTRLNRIIGQLEGVRRMIEERRYCGDILQQTTAVQSALRGLEAAVLEKFMNSCVRDAFTSNDESEMQKKVDELMKLFKRSGG